MRAWISTKFDGQMAPGTGTTRLNFQGQGQSKRGKVGCSCCTQ